MRITVSFDERRIKEKIKTKLLTPLYKIKQVKESYKLYKRKKYTEKQRSLSARWYKFLQAEFGEDLSPQVAEVKFQKVGFRSYRIISRNGFLVGELVGKKFSINSFGFTNMILSTRNISLTENGCLVFYNPQVIEVVKPVRISVTLMTSTLNVVSVDSNYSVSFTQFGAVLPYILEVLTNYCFQS